MTTPGSRFFVGGGHRLIPAGIAAVAIVIGVSLLGASGAAGDETVDVS